MQGMILKVRHLLILSALFSIVSCERDENIFERQGPVISPFVEVETFNQEVGFPVVLNIELRAVNGLQELVVTKDGEPFDQVQYPEDQLIATYELNYEVENLPDGTLIPFDFQLTDRQGISAEPFSFNVEVGPPFDIEDGEVFGTAVKIVSGRINRSITLTADNEYLMDGVISVEDNSTITIEPGTVIYMKTFDTEKTSRFVITQGSKVIAEGTKDSPIVFTSDRVINNTAAREDWGGVYLYGRARTNQGSTIFEENFIYGGTADNDNSGSLRYVRIEYAGKVTNDGLNLLGVGSGTQVSFVQVYNCGDNGIRFKGGTVDLKYAVVTNHAAYGLWAEHGWRGRGQFWVFQTSIPSTIVPVNFKNQARAVELRNDRNNFLLSPATYVQLSNITMIGNGNTDADGTKRGIRVRRGAMGIIHNLIVTNYPDDAVRVEDVPDDKLEDGTMVLGNIRSFSNKTNFDEQAENYFLPRPEFNLSEDPVPEVTLDNYVGSIPSNFNPTSLGSWFTSAQYIGAIKDAASDWTADGTWCKNIDGTIR